MPRKQIADIKNWIKSMGFELVKSHILNRKNTRINYYSLGNFGIYEEIFTFKKPDGECEEKNRKFISWTPWGEDFEVSSVKDLSSAYQDSLSYNPEMAY